MMLAASDLDGGALSTSPASGTAAPLVSVPYPTSTNPDIATPTYATLDYSGTSQPDLNDGPVGFTTTQIRSAYGVSQLNVNGSAPTGTGETIAIIDAYNDPDIAADLATFDQAMGLPAPPSFQVVSQTGSTTNLPEDDQSGWAVEESLDVEWSHAMAPGANIILVEADSADNVSLDAAVTYAASLPNVAVISMSYGSSEYSSETSEDSVYTTPAGHAGITFVASTGDYSAPGEYPAYSPNVVAAGGTTLTLDGDAYVSEEGWSGSGGGISQYEAQPSYQTGVVTQSLTNRTIPDISFDADPSTGVAIVDSYTYGTDDPWIEIGGTSVAAPCLSGLITLADQVRAESGLPSLDGPTQTLPALYSLPAADFNDVTTGNNGFAAGPGYDLVTGIGTPVANLLVPNLAGDTFYVTTTTPAADSTVATPPTSFTINFNEPIDTSSIELSDFAVNSQQPTSFTFTSTSITFNYSSSPVTSLGGQTMTLGGIAEQGTETPMTALDATFRYDPHPITVSSISPAAGSVATLPVTSLTVDYSEPFASGSIGDGNLQLSSGAVTGFSIENSTTVVYTISGVTLEGATAQLTVTIPAGAVTDPTGDPNQASYSATYTLQAVNAPLPAWSAAGPAGSLIYGSQVVGVLSDIGQTDSYTANLDAGETISLVATSSNGLEPAISVQGPGGIEVSTSAAAGNESAVIQTVTLTTSGSYTFSISGQDSTTGDYTLTADVNTAIESEQYGGASDNTLDTAQSLAGSFISLGGSGTRAAVLGAVASGGGQEWYSFTLSADDFVTLGGAVSAGSAVAIQLFDSSGDLLATGTVPAASFQQQVSDFTVATAGTYYVEVTSSDASDYSLLVNRDADFDDQVNTSLATAQVPAGPVNGSQTVLGNLGYETAETTGYSTIESFDSSTALNAYTFLAPDIDTASLAATAAHDGPLGLSLGDYSEWFYRDDSGDQVTEGEAISVWVEAQGTTNGRAYFGFGASGAGTLSLVVATNTDQLLLQDNTNYGYVTLAAVDQTYQASSWYLLQVVWGVGGNITGNLYASDGTTLINSVSANDSSFGATSGGIAFRGFDANGNDFAFDTVAVSPLHTATYSDNVQAGGTLSASTGTPGDGLAGIDDLSAELLVYNSSGTLVASDDPGPGGGNPSVSYTVPSGAGGTYYIQVAASPLASQPSEGDYTLTIDDTSVNHAPTLNTSIPPTLPTVLKNSTGGTGELVSSILATMAGGDPISDSDPGAVQGIAVTGADDTDGAWQFSTDNGTDWTAFPAVSVDNSLLLAAGALVRYVPASGFTGTVANALSFEAWDQTEGTNGGTYATLVTGGSTAFSTATANASLLVDAPPTIVGAYVSGANWSSTYLGVLASAGVGSSTLGFELASGTSQLATTVSWSNANQISIAFSEPVNVSQSSLTLYNGASTAASVSSFSYNSSTYVATWQFNSSLSAGEYLINLAGDSVTDLNGTELDGYWHTGVSTFSAGSGNGTPGGDFNFYFNVLPGDANSDGQVNGTDLLFMKLDAGSQTTTSNYRYDLQGSGTISSSYILTEKLNAGLNTTMFTQPSEPAQSASAPAVSTPSITIAAANSQASPAVVVVSPATGINELANVTVDAVASAADTTADPSPATAAATSAVSGSLAQSSVPISPAAPVQSQQTISTAPATDTAPATALQNISAVSAAAASVAIDAVFASLPSSTAGMVAATAAADSAPLENLSTVSAPSVGLPVLTALFDLFGDEQAAPANVNPIVSTQSAWTPSARTEQAIWKWADLPASALINPKLAAKAQAPDEAADSATTDSGRL